MNFLPIIARKPGDVEAKRVEDVLRAQLKSSTEKFSKPQIQILEEEFATLKLNRKLI